MTFQSYQRPRVSRSSAWHYDAHGSCGWRRDSFTPCEPPKPLADALLGYEPARHKVCISFGVSARPVTKDADDSDGALLASRVVANLMERGRP